MMGPNDMDLLSPSYVYLIFGYCEILLLFVELKYAMKPLGSFGRLLFLTQILANCNSGSDRV